MKQYCFGCLVTKKSKTLKSRTLPLCCGKANNNIYIYKVREFLLT